MKRNFESGAQKRKKVKKEELFIKNLKNINSYFQTTNTSTENSTDVTTLSVNLDSSVSNSSSILPVDQNDNTETVISYSDNDNGSKEQSTDPPLEPHVLEIGPSTSNTPNYIESNYTDDRINDNGQSAIPHISDSQLNEPSSDPALWELFRGSRNALQEYWIKNGFTKCQNFDIHADYKASVRNYESIEGNKKINRPRKLQNSYFYRELQNGEKVKREWVLYSPSQGKIFCFFCKLLNESDTSFTTGFNDWKHGLKSISDHENSSEHRKNLYTYIRRTKVVGRIDTELQLQLNEERNYWIEVFRRIVAVIKFLASRGLPFRGSNEIFGSNRNGNYLGMLELISEFDPFLREHIKKFGNSGRGKTSFLSSTICEELIEIMGKKVFMGIIAEIRQAKYYSISIDSTPDVSHVDQLTFIIRYCKNGKSVERFLKFIPIYGHDAENLCEVVIKFLNENDISISNCRGQSYDNAANMAGRYNGLQARINDINSLAFFIPCSAHSLNLVGVQAAQSTEEVCKYFDFVQNLYTFFSASTHRWAVLIRALATLGPRQKVVKNLSDTRWSARADAVFALNNGYKPIKTALETLITAENESEETKTRATGLKKNMERLETVFLTIFWNDVLMRLNKTNKMLQKTTLTLSVAVKMLKSLTLYISEKRNKFDWYEKRANEIAPNSVYKDINKRIKKRSTRLTYFDNTDTPDPDVILEGSEKFKIETFLPVIDTLLNNLTKRSKAYENIFEIFGFLEILTDVNEQTLTNSCTHFASIYNKDVNETELISECFHLRAYLKNELKINSHLLQKEKFSTEKEEFKDGTKDIEGQEKIKKQEEEMSESERTTDRESDSDQEADLNEEKSENASIQKLNLKSLYYYLYENHLFEAFPNVEIALRIHLCMMISNATGERSFSKLKLIKNVLRNTMTEGRLNNLSIISIENEFFKTLNFNDVIQDFANKKLRRRLVH